MNHMTATCSCNVMTAGFWRQLRYASFAPPRYLWGKYAAHHQSNTACMHQPPLNVPFLAVIPTNQRCIHLPAQDQSMVASDTRTVHH